MTRSEKILKLHSLYTGSTNGQWYLSWLESLSDVQIEIYFNRAFPLAKLKP